MIAPLEIAERQRVMLAISRARNRYPNPISTVLIDYLQAWMAFGYRISTTSAPQKLVDYLLD